jgi:carotenoid cleavage dioxygenase-like enzyme
VLESASTRRELLRQGAGATLGLAAGGALAPLAAGAPRRTGHALGFASLREEVRLPALAVEGRMPPWLSGVLLRNGPALFEVGSERFNHWFDGLAMLHAFAFGRGRVSYANRFLRSSAYRAWKRDGRIEYSEFATDPCRAIFSGVSSVPILAPVPNANVSIEALAGRFVAHTEIPIPVRFDPRTLRTLGVSGTVPLGRLGTAHPHRDPKTGARFSYEVELVPPSGCRVVAERGGRRRELAWLPRSEPWYMHSFALTPRYVAVIEQPFAVDPLDFLQPGRPPIIANYRWKRSEPARVHLIDRRGGGGVRATVEVDPFFVFHHVNAYERGDRVVLDLCAHRDSSIIDSLYLKRVRKGMAGKPSVRLRRLEIDPSRSRGATRELADVDFELPRIDYARFNQRPYRYAYGVGQRTRASAFIDQLAKVDVRSGEALTWRERGCYPGEPVFVRRPGGRREDDGVLLSVVLDARARSSFLLVLDARSLAERARAVVPHHIPFGFHGLHVER